MKKLLCVMFLLFSNQVFAQSEPQPEAAKLMNVAFTMLEVGKWDTSRVAFRAALKTGDLNVPGKAIAYWHIAICSMQLKDEDSTAEAFFFFSVVGQELLEEEYYRRFNKEFDVENKIKLATGYVQALWISRTKGVK